MTNIYCTLAQIIQLYPEVTIKDTYPGIGTIVLIDNSDGLGPFIKTWNYSAQPCPTQDQINALSK